MPVSRIPASRCIHGSCAGFSLPRISVIIPFHDPRGHPENVAGWTQAQTLADEEFEVLVVTDGGQEKATLAELRRLLRPGDRMLEAEATGSFALYAVGAEQARGDILFFTEDHCVADPDCLAKALEHLDRTGEDAASVRWGHINNTRVAFMEELVNRRDTPQWSRPDHWNKVRIRGFAARRAAYEDAGGFDWKFAGFSEAVLAAKLHARGHRVGYVADSGIRHINTETFSELRKNAWEYSSAECAYCATEDEAFCERYFSASTVLLRYTQMPPVTARALAKALLRVLWRDRSLLRGAGPSSAMGALVTAVQLATKGLARSLAPLFARIGIGSARLRFHFWHWSEARQLQAFSDYWTRVSHLARVLYLSQHEIRARPAPPLPAEDGGAVLAQGGLGCHGLEVYEGRTFRWTTPVAQFRIAAAPADGWVTLDTGGLRGSARHFPMGFLWNGRLIPRKKVSTRGGVLQFRVKREWSNDGGVQELVIAVAPALKNGGEQRWLGLPLCSLRVTEERPDVHSAHANDAPDPTASPAAVSVTEDALRVLLVNTADQGGGAEAVAVSLLDGLAACGWSARMMVAAKRTNRTDVEVLHALAPSGSRVRRTVGRALGREDFSFPATWTLLNDSARAADVVHCHNLHGDYFDLRVLPQLSRQVPVCVTLHDSWAFTGHCAVPGSCARWEQGCGQCPDLARPPAILRDATAENWQLKAEIFRESRLHVAVPSRWMLERVQRSLMAPALVEARVIPNGVCLDIFKPEEKSAARSRLSVERDVFLLVFAAFTGAANPHKDFATLREAVVRLGRANAGHPIVFVVLGQAAPDEVFDGVQIRHLPMQAAEETAAWLQAADAYVHAAWDESFCLAAAEAMACGTPVVATASGAIPEVVRDGVDGLLSPVGGAESLAKSLEKLLRDGPMRLELGRAAAVRARECFGLDRMLGDYVNWFTEVRAAFRQ